MKITLNELRRLVKNIIKEEMSPSGGTDCSKFQKISRQQFLNDVKNLSDKTGSDTDEAKTYVSNSRTIYKFIGTTEEANKNLSCIQLKKGISDYDFYVPNLYTDIRAKKKSEYFYIGVK
jgi:hypothetical protein